MKNFNGLIIIILNIFVLLSCTNPFSTREPELPSSSDKTNIYEPALEANIVIKNFQRSIEQKNITEYMKNFHDSNVDNSHTYYFMPEKYYMEEFNEIWSIMDEYDYFNALIHSSTNDFPHIKFEIADSTIIFSPINSSAMNDSLITNNFKYRLVVEYPDTTEEYKATMILKLAKSRVSPEYWHIYFWQDYANDDNYKQTWTYLKLKSIAALNGR